MAEKAMSPPPRQARSRETMDRLLAAVETLLEKKPFGEIAVSDIVEAANSSVGSFYARFGSKEGLLPHLYERYDRVLTKRMEKGLTSPGRGGAPAAVIARRLIEHRVRMFRKRRWMLHAVGLYARSEPNRIPAEMLARRETMHQRIAELSAAALGLGDGTEAVNAVRRALYFVSAVCRDKIVFPGPHARATAVSDRELVDELTRVFLAYLGVDPNEATN